MMVLLSRNICLCLCLVGIVLVPVFVQSSDTSFNDEVLGLIVFKAGLRDPQARLVSWTEDDDSPCNWPGVMCDPLTRHVTRLSLDGFGLSGHIGRGLLQLRYLQRLSLSNNDFNGTINPDLGQLRSLETVDLSGNSLSGLVPDGFFKQCGSLKSVSFAMNSLTGQLPASLAACSTLQVVNVSSNRLSGQLPSGLWSMKGIQSLDLSNNLLEGEIPVGISSLKELTVINLQGNNFTGQLPADIGSSSVLQMLDFSHNSLSGSLPESLQRLSSCTHLKLRGNLFGGEVPSWIGGLTNLETLDLSAIKKLTVSSFIKSQEGFEREVKKLGKIRHQHLVALEGFYWTPNLHLLIYDYIPKGSLYKHLHDETGASCLPWRHRFNLILGIAKGLAHLHQKNIIHYNLKSTNVLIDECGEPKLGDFGLARLLPALDRCILSSKIQSALGYMAPEFACRTVKITEKCDVYGFGILLLEVVTGKRPVEYMEDDVVVLCDMVRRALEDGNVEECVDVRLRGNFPVEEAIHVIKLGLFCASQVPSNRPDMEEVINILELIRVPTEGQEELE